MAFGVAFGANITDLREIGDYLFERQPTVQLAKIHALKDKRVVPRSACHRARKSRNEPQPGDGKTALAMKARAKASAILKRPTTTGRMCLDKRLNRLHIQNRDKTLVVLGQAAEVLSEIGE